MYTFCDCDLGIRESNAHFMELIHDYQGTPIEEQTYAHSKEESDVETGGQAGSSYSTNRTYHR